MSDIFREVEEDVRRERLEKFWKAYGDYVIAALAIFLVAVGGYEIWQRYDSSRRAKASDAFVAIQRISNPMQAASAFSDFSKDAPSGYGLLGRLSSASASYASGQTASAVAQFKSIAEEDKGAIGAVARLRAAWALADNASRSEIATLLAPLTDPGSAWRQMAQEVLAYCDYRAQNLKAAQSEYAALEKDPQAPDAVRARARGMAMFLAGGAAGDYGTVPPPAPVAPPGALPSAAAPPVPAAPAQ